MATRVISGVMVAVLAFVFCFLGAPILNIGLGIISIIGYLEVTKVLEVREPNNKIRGLEIVGIIFIVGLYGSSLLSTVSPMFRPSTNTLAMFMMFALVFMMIVFVVKFPEYHIKQVLSTFFAFAYCPALLYFMLLIRIQGVEGIGFSDLKIIPSYSLGFAYIWMVFAIAWGTDTCAYFVGVLFGKHKLFPILSPKKTIEGCLGGVVGTGLFTLLHSFVFMGHIQYSIGGRIAFVVFGMIGSVIGQLGDLAASGIKRNYGIKDYGNLIPGHGGVMDRFDSIVVIVLYVYFFMNQNFIPINF